MNAGAGLGKNGDRIAGIPIQHISDGQRLGAAKHELVTTGDHELHLVGRDQLQIVVFKAVVQRQLDASGCEKSLFNPDVEGRKLDIGDEAHA